MRTALLFSLACVIACGSSPATIRSPKASVTHRVGKEAPFVAFEASGWSEMRETAPSDQLILVRPDRQDLAIAVWTEEAEPGETVESVVTHWAILILSVPTTFQPTQVTKPDVLSDEEVTFGVRGVDGKGIPMASVCRVKLVSGHGTAKWAIVYTVSPEVDAGQMIIEAAGIVRTLRIDPQTPSP